MSPAILLTVILFLILIVLAGVAVYLSNVYERLSMMARQIIFLRGPAKGEDPEQIARREKQRIAEHFIDDGAQTVENLHKSISGITFGILENIPVTRRPSKMVHEIHDKTTGGVYKTIRTINKSIASVVGGRRKK